MFMRLQHVSRWTTLVVCSLLLAPLLIACGGGGSSGTTSAPPPAPPTTSSSTAMTTLTGNGFTISYPQTWRVSRSGSRVVTFTDSTGTSKLAITTILDPMGSINADALANAAIKVATTALKNAQAVAVPASTTVGGQNWLQKSVSGTQRVSNRGATFQVVVLASVHPSNAPQSKGYTIDYGTTTATFNQANTTYFQPMLQSFKFV